MPNPTPPHEWTRPPPRTPRTITAAPLTIFYGVPAETIAQVCAIALSTAKAYKAGKRKPSKQTVRLMQLHNAGRILPEPWRGWSFDGEHIFPPGAHKGLSRARIESYAFLMAHLFDWIRDDEDKRRQVQLYLDQLEQGQRQHG